MRKLKKDKKVKKSKIAMLENALLDYIIKNVEAPPTTEDKKILPLMALTLILLWKFKYEKSR